MEKSKKAAGSKKRPVAASAAKLTERADLAPDASVGALLLHSERLVKTATTHADALAAAKVTAKHVGELGARVAALRAAESTWQKARAAAVPGVVAKARDALTLGREDLLGALRVFVDDDAETQHALDALGGVDDDDDLEADVEALLPLARAHAAELKGTEITPAHVNRVEKALGAFRAARAGARGPASDETSAQALSSAALDARRARNEAYWSLSALNRQVCARARFCFRRDPKRRALFSSYSIERPGARKKAPGAPPAKPTA